VQGSWSYAVGSAFRFWISMQWEYMSALIIATDRTKIQGLSEEIFLRRKS
jgi:hypothetical protein